MMRRFVEPVFQFVKGASDPVRLLRDYPECQDTAHIYRCYLPSLLEKMEIDDVCPILVDADIFGYDTFGFYSLIHTNITVLPTHFHNYKNSNIYKYYTEYNEFLDSGVNFSMFVLAHELQHYKQHTEERFMAAPGGYYWEGKEFSLKEAHSIPYQERPWEVDANAAAFEVVPMVINNV